MITADRSLIGSADAVVFHFMTEDFRLNDLPKMRSPSQRYVFFTVEAPPTYKLWQRDMLHAHRSFFLVSLCSKVILSCLEENLIVIAK